MLYSSLRKCWFLNAKRYMFMVGVQVSTLGKSFLFEVFRTLVAYCGMQRKLCLIQASRRQGWQLSPFFCLIVFCFLFTQILRNAA